ncbi:MAG: hypothetical protein ACJ8J0_23510 [Longimicrobiaceae bacterium]
MSSTTDFTVYSPDHRLQMAVEVKYRPGASDEWASQFRRKLLQHAIVPDAHYFFLVLPEFSYLWGNGEPATEAPSAKLRTEELLQSLFQSNPVRPMNEEGLELAVQAWLQAVTLLPREEIARRHGWLVESGLYDRIRNGRVEYSPAA